MAEDLLLRKFMGLLDNDKRLYKLEEGEVDKEEFEFCRVIDQIIFGDKGYVQTLGPTWELVHDPRFLKLECCFVDKRASVFGGDAAKGRAYVDGKTFMSSTIQDVEQYAEIIGEGRHFRIAAIANGFDPQQVKDLSDDDLWRLVRRECDNYFDQNGKPNKVAIVLFQLLKADLVGLIDDYAQEPHVDQWVSALTGEIIDEAIVRDRTSDHSQNPPIYLEIDLLEKALTMRNTLRCTAFRVLKSVGMSQHLTNETYLTDMECDQMLRMIYQSNWPDDKPLLMTNLLTYMQSAQLTPYEERLAKERAVAKVNAQEVAQKLRTGEIPRVNQFTEPVTEAPTGDAAVLDQIIKNPLKGELFQQWVAVDPTAEKFPDVKAVFEDPDYVLTEEKFVEFIVLLNGGELPADMQRKNIDSPLWDLPSDLTSIN